MKITALWKQIAKEEGLKKQVNIAQIAEIIRCMRKIIKAKSGQDFYVWIKDL